MICSVLKRATTKYYLIQSFSDVITNSSSETYVVDTSYTAKALQRALEAIHKQHEDAEYYSGECCGIEVSDFKEFCCVDKFLVENFKCISSDHERPKDEEGRIVKY